MFCDPIPPFRDLLHQAQQYDIFTRAMEGSSTTQAAFFANDHAKPARDGNQNSSRSQSVSSGRSNFGGNQNSRGGHRSTNSGGRNNGGQRKPYIPRCQICREDHYADKCPLYLQARGASQSPNTSAHLAQAFTSSCNITEPVSDWYVDTGASAHMTSQTSDLDKFEPYSDLSVKRKIEKSREKVLRCDSVLQRNPFIKPIPSSIQKKKTSKKSAKAVPTAEDKDAAHDNLMDVSAHDSDTADLWKENGEGNVKIKKKPKPTIIPAVEVEPPGCSFNPHPESHQDALARAVADEMQKIYQHELGPEPIPLVVPGEAIDEEDKYFLDADNGSDDDSQNENPVDDGEANTEDRPHKTKRVTQVVLNRRARRKEQLRIEAEAKKLEGFSREIDSIPDIMQEIEKEDEEKQKRHLRRVVAKQERSKIRPPRLGKYKFESAPLQVLLSEEKTGSLRQLKGCCTLVRDRFKSLEQRGLVVPSKKGSRR